MIPILIRYDLGRLRLVYGLLLMLLATYLLLPMTGPLYPMDPGIVALAMAIGSCLAIGVFSDPVDTQAWIFSRGLTRDDLFTHRLALGIVLIGIATLLPLLVVLLGIRSILYQDISPYYPTVRWLELPIAGTFFMFACLTFCVQGCLASLRLLAGNRRSGKVSRTFTIVIELLATCLICGSFAAAISVAQLNGTLGLMPAMIPLSAAIASVWLMCLTRHAWRNFEID